MRRAMLVVMALVGTVGASAGAAAAQESAIEGLARDSSTGAPLDGVHVDLLRDGTPIASSVTDADGRFVYLVEKTGDNLGVARRREVTVGQISDQGLEVLTGLSNGDLLVTAGVTRIRDGLRVKLQ